MHFPQIVNQVIILLILGTNSLTNPYKKIIKGNVISNLNCVGSLCSAQYITQYNCSAKKGVIFQRNCYLCGNGQIYSNGQCVNNCGPNLYYNGQICVCNNGFSTINGICTPICGIN